MKILCLFQSRVQATKARLSHVQYKCCVRIRIEKCVCQRSFTLIHHQNAKNESRFSHRCYQHENPVVTGSSRLKKTWTVDTLNNERLSSLDNKKNSQLIALDPSSHCSVAGTTGAVVTCPLEVVKTRLQSSNAFHYPSSTQTSKIAELPGLQNPTSDALRRPDEQRRRFSSKILRVRHSQVMKSPFYL